MAFTEADLNIAQGEIDEIKEALFSNGQADVFASTMAENERKARDYTAMRVVPEDTLRRIWRALVLCEITRLAGRTMEAREKGFETAMKELTDIRDGKFPQYALADPQTPGLAQTSAAWGGAAKIKTNR